MGTAVVRCFCWLSPRGLSSLVGAAWATAPRVLPRSTLAPASEDESRRRVGVKAVWVRVAAECVAPYVLRCAIRRCFARRAGVDVFVTRVTSNEAPA